jgi:hypothetical protein
MKNIKFLIPLIAITLFSCNDYLDTNTSPDLLLIDQVGPSLLLPAAQVGTYRVQATTMNQLGNIFSNAWASNVQSFTGGYAREFQLTIDNAFYTGIWDGLYLNINNLQKIIDYPNTDHKYDYYVAVAKILKAHYMQHIVDIYGDVPYDEAFNGLANKTPKYNDDQYIYRKLLGELDDARAIIANSDPAVAEDISSTDVMLYGDMDKWSRFANTIELRMLLRMSNNTGAVATYRDARLTALSSKNFLTTDVSINPGYSDSNDGALNPFYATFGFDAALTATSNRTFICPSGHVYKSMIVSSNYSTTGTPEIIAGSGIFYPNVTDPRFARIFSAGARQPYRRAVTQGSTVCDVFPTTGVVGLPGRIGTGNFNPYNLITEATFPGAAAANGYVMSLSETKFMLAEAALRYPAFGSAETYFNEGVTASFAYFTSTIGTYLTTINTTKPNFGFNIANTFSENLHAIMYQKWASQIGVNGIESYIDYNRTGFPLTPLALTATKTRKPRRLIYPISEYVANSANVPNLTEAQIFADSDPSFPFWQLGNPTLGN